MAITLAQAVVQSGVLVGTTQVEGTFGSNTTTGNTIVVVAGGFDTSSTVSSIQINAGAATFAPIIAAPESGGNYGSCEAWAAPNITGGTTPKVTVTFSGAVAAVDVWLYELAGMPSSITQDGTAAVNTGTNSTTFTSPSITTTNAGSIVFAASAANNFWSSGQAGWNWTSGAGQGGGVEYQIQTSTQSGLTATMSGSGNTRWSGLIFALKPLTSTNVNATVTIAGNKSGVATSQVTKDATDSIAGRLELTITPLVTHDAQVTMQGTEHLTASGVFYVYGTAIILGSVSSFHPTPNLPDYVTASIGGVSNVRTNASANISKAATVNISGRSTLSYVGSAVDPADVFATVFLRGLATRQALLRIAPRASVTAAGAIPIPQVTIHGRSSASASSANVTHNVTGYAIAGRGRFSYIQPDVHSSAINVSGTVRFIGTRSTLSEAIAKTVNAEVLIEGGNYLGSFPLEASVSLTGDATVTFTARIIRDAVLTINGTFRSARSVFNASVTGAVINNVTLRVAPFLTFHPAAFVTHSASVTVLGKAALNASGNVSTLSFRNAAVTISGHVLTSPTSRVVHDAIVSVAGTASHSTYTSNDLVFISPIARIVARTSLTFNPQIIHDGTVTVVGRSHANVTGSATVTNIDNAAVTIHGRTALSATPRVTQSVTLSIAARQTNNLISSAFVPNQINAAVTVSGRDHLTPFANPVQVLGTVTIRGRQSALNAVGFLVVDLNVRAAISGTSLRTFRGFVQGGTQVNGDVIIHGSGQHVSATSRLNQNVVTQIITSSSRSFTAFMLRNSIINVQGKARAIFATPHQPIVWISANTQLYKVWQYNLESMVRALGTSWTVTSSGLSFQGVAVELVTTEAGWGN